LTWCEAVFIALCIGAVALIWFEWMGMQRSLSHAQDSLITQQGERDAWRERTQRLLRGLGEEIEAQLGLWVCREPSGRSLFSY
jgi:hypothetical protein